MPKRPNVNIANSSDQFWNEFFLKILNILQLNLYIVFNFMILRFCYNYNFEKLRAELCLANISPVTERSLEE